MALKFIDELPEGVVKRKANANKVFTEDLADELQENEGKWALINGGTGQGAAAWVKRVEKAGRTGFEYSTVDTGKPDGEPRPAPNGSGTYQPTLKDVYVRYNPELADK